MSVGDLPARPLRADAERNRRRIVAAAAEVFAERGLDVSLDDVAARAGVGVGTVYRRFPDKDALIDAVFEAKIRAVEERAREAERLEDPWEAFATFMRVVCEMQARDRGLKEAMLSTDRGHERVQRARETIAPIGRAVLERAQGAGVVRPDVALSDMPLMHLAVGFVAERTADAAPDAWQRMVTILLDGVAVPPRERSAMPAPPLPFAALPAVMTRKRC